jgi:primosomal protein N' (replication factor Y)
MKYCYVRCLSGYRSALLYSLPELLQSDIVPGSLVTVPLQKRSTSALVEQVIDVLPTSASFKIRPVNNIIALPSDKKFHSFARLLADTYCCPVTHIYERVYRFLREKIADYDVQPSIIERDDTAHIALTEEQQAIVDYLVPALDAQRYAPTLIHGVTGSGKTEVYKRLIVYACRQKKSVILLLPEVTLAEQFYYLLSRQLPSISMFRFHSACSMPERKTLWQAIMNRQPVVIIGVHMPIFLPLVNLGLIIIDEEHEQGFVEKKHPRFNSKELALLRARHYKIPVVLGSATPSISSLYNIKRRGWKLFSITKRFSGAFPQIKKVSLLERSPRKRRFFWVSQELEEAVRQTLAKKEQVIIYLNRRGFSFFVQCKSCGVSVNCPSCSVSLTYHRLRDDEEILRCHYCDHKEQFKSWCNDCSATTEFLKKGLGTQQVVSVFTTLFPEASIARADLDSTTKKKAWRQTVEAFEQGDIDILIGTQTVTKGYHFPGVTLVGILWADLSLHFPSYIASETTLQQLIQVAGRAGRQRNESTVIVQILNDHSIFNYLNERSYLSFCEEELKTRALLGYPPVQRLATIELRHNNVERLDADADQLYQDLENFCEENKLDVTLRGPTVPVVYKIRNYEMRHIIIKSSYFDVIKKLIQSHCQKNHLAQKDQTPLHRDRSEIFFSMNQL